MAVLKERIKNLIAALQRIQEGTARRIDYAIWGFVVWCITLAWIKVAETLIQKFNPSFLLRVFMATPALASVVVMSHFLVKCWRIKQ